MKFMFKLLVPLLILMSAFSHADTVVDTTAFKYRHIDYFGEVASPQRETLTSGVEQSTNAFSWINTRTTTGFKFGMYGDRIMFYHWSPNVINGADRSYGYALQYMYDTYCQLAGEAKYCLGKSLWVEMRTWKSGSSNRQFMYKFSGRTYTTDSRRQLQRQFMADLISAFGARGIPTTVNHALSKKYVAVDIDLVGGISTFNNTVWLGKLFKVMNTYLDKDVAYTLGTVTTLTDATLTSLDLPALLPRVSNRGTYGRIKAVVSAKRNASYWGWSYYHYSLSPVFTMVETTKWPIADKNTTKYIDHLARVLMHELGHNLQLSHSDTIETYWRAGDPAFNIWQGYYQSLTAVDRY